MMWMKRSRISQYIGSEAVSAESLHHAGCAPSDLVSPAGEHPGAGKAGGLDRMSVYRPSDATFYVSPDRQRELNRERAARDGYTLVSEFTDLDAPSLAR